MRKSVQITFAHLLLTLSAACAASEGGNQARTSTEAGQLVVLAITSGRNGYEDPIKGTVPCDFERGMFCGRDAVELARAVLSCGPLQATIDRSISHVEYVYFESNLRERLPAVEFPSDLEIVRCVQQSVGFRFSAGMASSSDDLPALDQHPFEPLHERQ